MTAAALPSMPPDRCRDARHVGITAAPGTGSPFLQGGERRSSEPLDRLGRRLDAICTNAVDPLQIAAALEADGLNDSLAAERYEGRDVFQTAEALYDRVPFRRDPAGSAPTASIDTEHSWLRILKGGLFALPAVFYLVTPRLFGPVDAAIALVIAMVVGWSVSQVIAAIAYGAIGHGSRRAAGRFEAKAIACLVLAAAACSGLAVAYGAPPGVAMLASAQVLYMQAAGALLLLDRPVLLLATLAPGTAAAIVYKTRWPVAVSAEWATVAIAASVLIAVVVAIAVAGSQTAETKPVRIGRREMLKALPFGVFGAFCATVLSFPAILWLADPSMTVSAVLGLPLVLSMGAAEWQMVQYKRRSGRALTLSRDVDCFKRRAQVLFLLSLGIYVGILLLLTVGVLSVFVDLSDKHYSYSGQMALAYTLLGAALFIALVFLSSHKVGPVLTASVIMLTVFLGLAFTRLPGLGVIQDFTISCATFFVVNLVLSRKDVEMVGMHV